MDIKEVREKKEVLRRSIVKLMAAFETETDLKINDISITSRTSRPGNIDNSVVNSVLVKVLL